MRHFQQIAAGIDVLPLLAALHRQPELWNVHRDRTGDPDSPHAEVHDIWLRFRAYEDLTTPEAFAEPFEPVFYPAWHCLPPVRPLVFQLMARLEAVQLGAVLITLVPPGARVRPHSDRGRWHPEFFNTKIYIPLLTNDGCINTAGDEAVTMRVGEAWIFNNLVTHATINDGTTERMTLIVSLRCE